MEIRKAKRKAIPAVISLEAPSSCGKTFGALVIAAGMVGKNGKIGFVDTERGRGEMYTDDPYIMELIPNGYDYIEITEPFTPEKYVEAIRKFDYCDIIIIDSGSHEWEGDGGCCDIAETNKLGGNPNWALSKLRHKKLINVITQSRQDLIICLRASEKSKPVRGDDGKMKWKELGIMPTCEKNFPFEMTIRIQLDEAYKPSCKKAPREVKQHFTDKLLLLTPEIGKAIKRWSNAGETINIELRALKQECREAAMFGNTSLDDFFKNLAIDRKNMLKNYSNEEFQKECRSLADESDRVTKAAEEEKNNGGLFEDAA